MNLMSVTGPVETDAISLADAHNHLWIAPAADAEAGAPALMDFAQRLAELKVFRESAARNQPACCVQFDCQPGGFGRDARMLRAMSEESGVTIVCCTGYHLRKYGPSHWLWTASAADAAAHFIRELSTGVDESPPETPIRAGFIKIAFEQDPHSTPPALIAAVGAAVQATGCAVEVHTERGMAAEQILPLLVSHGIPADRIVLCHMDKRRDLALHRDLIAAGALLEYDTFTRTGKYGSPFPFWSQAFGAGMEDGIAIATDMAEARSEEAGEALARLRAVMAEQAVAGREAIQKATCRNIVQRLALRKAL